MPAIKLCGRSWALASDDIPLVASGTGLFHLTWGLALLLGFCMLGQPPLGCAANGHEYYIVMAGLFSVFLASALVEGWLVIEGWKGTMFETEKRWMVVPLLYLRILLGYVEITWLAVGTYVAYRGAHPDCLARMQHAHWHAKGITRGMVWGTWGVLGVQLAWLLLSFNFFPNYKDPKSWERRLRCVATIFWCCDRRFQADEPDGRAAPLARIAHVLEHMFSHVDMTLTDFLTAFLLTAQAHINQRKRQAAGHKPSSVSAEATRASSNSGTELLPVVASPAASRDLLTRPLLSHGGSSEPDVRFAVEENGDPEEGSPKERSVEVDPEMNPEVDPETIGTAAHFCGFAFATYGYMLYLWTQPKYAGVCGLLCGRGCGCWLHPMRSLRAADPLAPLRVTNHMNREALLQMSGIQEEDLIFVRYQNEARDRKCVPYFIALDRSTRSVVLAIRGTLSLNDFLTDFLCEPAALDNWLSAGNPANPSRAADPSKNPTPDPDPCAGSSPRGGQPPPNFGMQPPEVVAANEQSHASAHSGILDAAKAVVEDLREVGILQVLMEGGGALKGGKEELPDCRDWQLVVTGHSLDPAVCDAAVGFITGVVLNNDWVARLTVDTFERLRHDMIMNALRCKVPKATFLLGFILGRRWEDSELFAQDLDSVTRAANEAHVAYGASLEQLETGEDRFRLSIARSFRTPGRIIHLQLEDPVPNPASQKRPRRQYRPVWTTSEALTGGGILVSTRMMADHMPDYQYNTLRRLALRLNKPAPPAPESLAAGQGALREIQVVEAAERSMS